METFLVFSEKMKKANGTILLGKQRNGVPFASWANELYYGPKV